MSFAFSATNRLDSQGASVNEQQICPSPSTRQRIWLLAVLCLLTFVATVVLVASHRRFAGNEGGSIAQTAAPPEQIEKLTAGLASADSRRRLESAIGLLQLGRTEAGASLLALSTDSDANVRKTAVAEFGRVARPAGETLGVLLDWPTDPNTPPTAAQVVSATAFWEQRVTPALLRDVQVRLAGTDPQWAELNRMLIIRDALYRISGTRLSKRMP